MAASHRAEASQEAVRVVAVEASPEAVLLAAEEVAEVIADKKNRVSKRAPYSLLNGYAVKRLMCSQHVRRIEQLVQLLFAHQIMLQD